MINRNSRLFKTRWEVRVVSVWRCVTWLKSYHIACACGELRCCSELWGKLDIWTPRLVHVPLSCASAIVHVGKIYYHMNYTCHSPDPGWNRTSTMSPVLQCGGPFWEILWRHSLIGHVHIASWGAYYFMLFEFVIHSVPLFGLISLFKRMFVKYRYKTILHTFRITR